MGRHIYLYKRENGKRQKYRFTLDERMTIMEELPCHENGTPLRDTEKLQREGKQTEAALAASPQLQRLKERGYKFHLADGRIHVDSIPDVEQQIAMFFVLGTECPFPGCEALRERYQEDLDALKGEDGKCSDCNRGALQEKYRKIVLKHLEKHRANDTLPQRDPRDQEISGSEKSTQLRAVEKR